MEIPEYLQANVSEILVAEHVGALRRGHWAVILGLRPEKDGNQWSVLWGPNMMEGVCSFGDTPEQAIENFDIEMNKRIPIPEG